MSVLSFVVVGGFPGVFPLAAAEFPPEEVCTDVLVDRCFPVPDPCEHGCEPPDLCETPLGPFLEMCGGGGIDPCAGDPNPCEVPDPCTTPLGPFLTTCGGGPGDPCELPGASLLPTCGGSP